MTNKNINNNLHKLKLQWKRIKSRNIQRFQLLGTKNKIVLMVGLCETEDDLFSSSATRTHTSLNKAWEFWIHHYPLRTLASIQRLQKTVEPLLLQPTKDCVGGNCKVWQSLYKHNMREKGGFGVLFFFNTKDKNTPLPCSSVQDSKFTPLSSRS